MTGMRYETAGENPAPITVNDSSDWFVEQGFGLGKLRAFRRTNDVSLFDKVNQTATANTATDPAAFEGASRSLSG